jgi:hypothetical protein
LPNKSIKAEISQAWHTPVISALKRFRQEDHKFKARLGYIV